MADQTLAQLLASSPIPAGTPLSEVTVYATVTVAGVPVDGAFTLAQLLAWLVAAMGDETPSTTTSGGIGLTSDLSTDGLANH